MKKCCVILLSLFLCVGLAACAETKLLERVGLVTLVGYDFGKEEAVETTAVVRQVSTELQSKVAIITAENATTQGTRAKVNNRAAEKIMSGQLRGVLFGEEFASAGIGHNIETSLRNSTISGAMLLAVVEGETRPMLEYPYPEIDDIGEHIYKLLKQNIASEQVVSSTLHEVAHDYYSVGRDVAIPLLNRDEELIEISGIALFRRDKMVGKLSVEDSFYVKLMRDNYHAGSYEMKLKGEDLPTSLLKDPPDEINVVFDPIKTRKDVKLVNPTTPEFDLHITVQVRLLEIKPNINVGEVKNAEELEKVIGTGLSAELSRVIADCQEIGSDVFGFGEFYRSSVRHSELTEEKWHAMFKEMKVNIDFDVTLLRSGIFE
ncbi:Ger(x)C family spore germination protein [Sporosarcina sp. ACRSM]|uniref:Ger(x)C family spore germination protein n=1 Tax=Sporosarcina sp. ACRSM TaxID=2918216 RepID=UPI001EF7435B|nr:Ger(x)C family spore germination protein [Sporosarcina sp. ACRSM]MCG7337011.1 Ger(x)C family spore germination protein [Sporosarcina sp. ACRSM]